MAKKNRNGVQRSEAVELVSFLLALNGIFLLGYIASLLPKEAFTFVVFLRLLPEFLTSAMALFSAYGLLKLEPWSFSASVFTIGMIAHSVLSQLAGFVSSEISLLYGIVPLGIITALFYFWRREIFLSRIN